MKKKIIFGLLLSFFSISLVAVAPISVIAAEISGNPLEGLNQTAGNIDAFKEQTNNTDAYYKTFLSVKAGQAIGLVLSFIGVLFLVLMIYAGITWMTSQGNEQKISKAKSLIMDSIIGIIIVFAAYVLTTFLGGEILK